DDEMAREDRWERLLSQRGRSGIPAIDSSARSLPSPITRYDHCAALCHGKARCRRAGDLGLLLAANSVKFDSLWRGRAVRWSSMVETGRRSLVHLTFEEFVA